MQIVQENSGAPENVSVRILPGGTRPDRNDVRNYVRRMFRMFEDAQDGRC